jgi:membrane fusion protein, multidrug efflux system
MRRHRYHQYIVLLLAGLGGCRGRAAQADDASDGGAGGPPPVVGARTAVATEGPFVEAVTALGVVTTRPGRYAELSAPAPTRVTRIFVSAGDHVAAGMPLVEFDRAPFDAAAQSAAAALVNAEHAAQRARSLSAAGILPRRDADQAEADLAQARANAIVADRARELATLRSPISGVVTRMAAVLGASSDPSQSVVAVVDPSALDVAFTVSPTDGALVRPGAAVALTAGQGGGGGGAGGGRSAGDGESLGTGTITTIGATVDSASRGVTVRARLPHPNRELRVGEAVFARIATAVHPHAVTVPVQALVPDADGLKVFVVEAGRAHARRVTVGGRTEAVAEITSGLKAGEVVVTEGAYGVDDSAKVVPVTGADTAKGPGRS